MNTFDVFVRYRGSGLSIADRVPLAAVGVAVGGRTHFWNQPEMRGRGRAAKDVLRTGVLGFAVVLFAGCVSAPPHRAVIDMVPGTSEVVVSLDWSRVRSDPGLRLVIKADDIVQTLSSVGVPELLAQEAVVFADLDGGTNVGGGYLFAGAFSSRAVMRRLQAAGWRQLTVDGARVMADPSGKTWAHAAGPRQIAVGDTAAVRQVIGVTRHGQPAFVFRQPYDRMFARYAEQKAPLYAVVAFPQLVQDMAEVGSRLSGAALDAAGLGLIGSALTDVGMAHGLGFSVTPVEDKYRTELAAVMKDEGAARFISGTLGFLKGLAAVLPQSSGSEAQAAEDVRNLGVARDGELLYVAMLMTQAQLVSGR
jgi:hypothetical protein